MSERHWECDECGRLHGTCYEYAVECCAPEPAQVYVCDSCARRYDDEYDADTCCGGQPSQRALEARGQQRMEGL